MTDRSRGYDCDKVCHDNSAIILRRCRSIEVGFQLVVGASVHTGRKAKTTPDLEFCYCSALIVALHLLLHPHNHHLLFPLLSGHSLHPPPPTGLKYHVILEILWSKAGVQNPQALQSTTAHTQDIYSTLIQIIPGLVNVASEN